MHTPLAMGATIGIIGGGQLGRMLAMAAAKLGFKTVVLEPQEDCPAAQLCNRHIIAAYDDEKALQELAKACDVITFEFENIDVSAIEALTHKVPVYPNADALRISQDRLVEKAFLNKSGLKTAPYFDITDEASLKSALDETGGRGIMKTRRFGYDGKGQVRFSADNSPSPAQAMDEIKGAPAILEGFVDFTCEISVIASRGQDGEVVCFDPAENVHKNGILYSSAVPSKVSDKTIAAAVQSASDLISALEYVGTLGLEFFVMEDGSLIANEFAPRVHNSGHWTEAACVISQFEQHIRAITGWPLTSAYRHSDCEMFNLLGDDIHNLREIGEDPSVYLHSYGKAEAREGRKMGHFTRLFAKKSK